MPHHRDGTVAANLLLNHEVEDEITGQGDVQRLQRCEQAIGAGHLSLGVAGATTVDLAVDELRVEGALLHRGRRYHVQVGVEQ